jgi:ADP-ribosylglycohydrolase
MNTFTDDTVLAVATADVIMEGGSFLKKYQTSYFKYPNRGWGGMFHVMARAGNLRPYNSFGNGSAMRVSPCGWAYKSLKDTLDAAEQTAMVTHNHPEGIKGAQAIAGAIYLARNNMDKSQISDFVRDLGYAIPLLEDCSNQFDETCQGTIPLCMALFNESEDFEHAIRMTIAHGGDCDTTACIVGGIAEAYYGKPPEYMIDEVWSRLPDEMRRTVAKFVKTYCYNDFEEPTVKMNDESKLMDAFRSLFSN